MIHFSPEINFGTLLMAGSMLVAVVTFWVTQRHGLETLSEKLEEIRQDLKGVVGLANNHDKRIAVLEDREDRK